MSTDYTVKVDDVNDCVDVVAIPDDGAKRVILAVHGEIEQTEPIARRVAAMLKAYDARVDYDAGRRNSLSVPSGNTAVAVGDAQGGDCAELEAIAHEADEVADRWDAYATTLMTLLDPPALPRLEGFDPTVGRLGHGRDVVPRPLHHLDGDDEQTVERLVGGAVINATTYRRHATAIRAYIADRWGGDDLDAFPRGEADILH